MTAIDYGFGVRCKNYTDESGKMLRLTKHFSWSSQSIRFDWAAYAQFDTKEDALKAALKHSKFGDDAEFETVELG